MSETPRNDLSIPSDDVLAMAYKATAWDRQEEHGPPERSLDNIAALWAAYLRARFPDGKITTLLEEDVALMMGLLKVGRGVTKLSNNDDVPRDNWVDIAGYARLGDLVG